MLPTRDYLSASLRALVDFYLFIFLTALGENDAEWRSDGALRRSNKTTADKEDKQTRSCVRTLKGIVSSSGKSSDLMR